MVSFTGHDATVKPKSLRGRRLVVVDIENAMGGPMNDTAIVARTYAQIATAIQLCSNEQVVIGTSHFGAIAAGFGWARTPRLVVRSGVDGADLALLDVLTTEHVAQRFDEIVLVSGDGIFTDVIAALAALGVRATVVSRPESCSTRLRMAAAETVFLPTLDTLEGAA